MPNIPYRALHARAKLLDMDIQFTARLHHMMQVVLAALPPNFGKWLACTLIIVVPGSFAVVGLVWLAKHIAARMRLPQARAPMH